MIATAAKQQKTLWHSELRQRSEEGRVRLLLLSHPTASKYPGKPAFCRVRIEGEDRERTLMVESAEVSFTLENLPLHQPVEVFATGSGEDASLEVVEDVKEPSLSNRVRAAHTAENAPGRTNGTGERPTLARSYWEALDVAVSLVEEFKRRHEGREPTEAERAIATTLYIEMNRSGRPLSTEGR